ncbi:MAG: L-fucose mutarotase, partial [Clostridia bacterium]|nr:L-fucose mutarotase [Clostridia bacterium]
MLKGIPSIISPELLKIMMEMGHGDEIVIGDGNFPGKSINENCVRCDGHNVPELLGAMLKLFPLDTYAKPVYIMEKVPGDTVETPIWDEYRNIVKPYTNEELEQIERFAFYERAKKAYAVVMTGETALYANIILKKGVV